MLSLRYPYLRNHQMNTGSVDFRPPGSGGAPALPNAEQQAPSIDTNGIGFAAAGAAAGLVNEVLCFFSYSGGANPAVVSDRRHPGVFRVVARNAQTEFSGASSAEALADFKTAVLAYRQSCGTAIAVMVGDGTRHTDLQPKSAYSDVSQAPDTFDVLDGSQATVGCAFIARTSSTTTTQHWVMFGNQAFDQVKCVRRSSGGFSSLHAFLDAMQDARTSAFVAFPHAVDNVTHYLDLPWS
ncbi:MAG: hypothetical protein ABMA64_06570 [Myxococcota bacterium]